MTNKEKVAKLYPDCTCIKHDNNYFVFVLDNGQLLKFEARQSERSAWSWAWKKIQQRMIKKLES